MKHYYILSIILAALSSHVFAAPPMPSKKITDSGIIKDQPKQLEAKANDLSKKKTAIKDKLNKLQKELQSQAKEIQSQEEGLRKINQEVSTISGDIKKQKAQLKKVHMRRREEQILQTPSFPVDHGVIPCF